MNFLDAFKALDALNEDTYSLDGEGIKKLKEFQDTDDLTDEVTVIDVDAETEEDLSDSYVGKVILDCSVCHSKLYKGKDEVEIDEEQQLANVGEECPYCYTSDGFKVIGEVSPFNGETEVEVEETTTDDEQTEEPELAENLNESINNLEEATALADRPGTIAHALKDSMDELATVSNVGEMKQKVIDIVKASDVSDKEKSRAIAIFMKPKSATALLSTIGTFMTGIKTESLNESMRGDRLRLNAEILDVLGMDGYDVDSDDVIALADAATDLAFEEYLADTGKSLEQIAKDWLQSTKENYPEDLENLTLMESVKDSCIEEGIFGKKKSEKTIKASQLKKGDLIVATEDGRQNKPLKVKAIGNNGGSIAIDFPGGNMSISPDEDVTILTEGIFDKKPKSTKTIKASQLQRGHKIVATQDGKQDKPLKVKNVGENGGSVTIDFNGGNMSIHPDEDIEILDESKSIDEDINNLSLDTDDTHMEMTSDESGKVTITTEPIENKSDDSEGETIVPVSDETETEILANNDSEATDEVEVDIDEFDEESFDDLGESYFKKIYENVNSFKTSSVKKTDTSLIVEGILNIAGKSKKTNFIFESKDTNRSGRMRFIGENKELTNGCKAFTLRGKVQNSKFICESLNYNYKVTDEGKSRRIYGIVTRKG